MSIRPDFNAGVSPILIAEDLGMFDVIINKINKKVERKAKFGFNHGLMNYIDIVNICQLLLNCKLSVTDRDPVLF
jgi:hypothetical protein